MIDYATNSEGRREILGFGIYAIESKHTWNDFLKSLKDRGLHGVKMITSDAHEGIQNAISKVFPEAAWQRCQFHFSRNNIDKASKKYQAGLASELQEMFNCKTIEETRKRKDAIIADYSDVAETAMKCLVQERHRRSCRAALGADKRLPLSAAAIRRRLYLGGRL